MLIALKLGQYFTQRLAVEDQLAALPGGLRPGIGRCFQQLPADPRLALGNHHAIACTVTAHTEYRGAALHGLSPGIDHERPRVGGRLEQGLAGLEDNAALATAEIHRQGAATVEGDLRAIGQGDALLLANPGVVVGKQGRGLLHTAISDQRQHQRSGNFRAPAPPTWRRRYDFSRRAGLPEVRPQRLGFARGLGVSRAQRAPALVALLVAGAGVARMQQYLPVEGIIGQIADRLRRGHGKGISHGCV
ncbi:hypothetical protein D3C85_1255300 [compost metagenome]